MSSANLTFDAELEKLQRESFNYFLHETNPANWLVMDTTEAGWPASIAATGLALASYSVAVERESMPRAEPVERALMTPRSFWNSLQGPEPDTTGYKGFLLSFSRHADWPARLALRTVNNRECVSAGGCVDGGNAFCHR